MQTTPGLAAQAAALEVSTSGAATGAGAGAGGGGGGGGWGGGAGSVTGVVPSVERGTALCTAVRKAVETAAFGVAPPALSQSAPEERISATTANATGARVLLRTAVMRKPKPGR